MASVIFKSTMSTLDIFLASARFSPDASSICLCHRKLFSPLTPDKFGECNFQLAFALHLSPLIFAQLTLLLHLLNSVVNYCCCEGGGIASDPFYVHKWESTCSIS